jgi:hypothetical protein
MTGIVIHVLPLTLGSIPTLFILGHYVPQLARKIVEYNRASPHPFINLKGILVSTTLQICNNNSSPVDQSLILI